MRAVAYIDDGRIMSSDLRANTNLAAICEAMDWYAESVVPNHHRRSLALMTDCGQTMLEEAISSE